MERQYPFPSRTRKSSSLTPMILTLVGNVGCCRTFLFLCNIQKSLRLKEFIRTILTHIKKAVRNIAFIPNWPRSGAFFVRRKVLLLALKFKIIEILRIALSVGKLNFAEDETAVFLHIFTPQGE